VFYRDALKVIPMQLIIPGVDIELNQIIQAITRFMVPANNNCYNAAEECVFYGIKKSH
jgi:hypothetical protein